MSNNIFSQFRQPAPAQQQQAPDFQTAYNSFMQNPLKAISSFFNVPANVGNDPQSIANYLLQSGQVSQQELDAAQQQARQMFGNKR